jgi:PAS domain S-box-containing protein
MHRAANILARTAPHQRLSAQTTRARGVICRYGAALLLVGLAVAISYPLRAEIYTTPLFLAAIVISAWYGGTGPGVFAVFASAVAILYFFQLTRPGLAPHPYDLVRLVQFVFTGAVVTVAMAVHRRAQQSLQQARDQLEIKVAERTGELRKTNDQLQQEVAERRRADEILRERAGLLDLTHDTVFVRDMNDVITYWNRGAEELYGWRRQEAIGQIGHQLMRTIFPEPLDEINTKLLRAGRWEGELIHATRDDTPVVVASRWSLQRDERGNPIAILETNNNITERRQAEEALRRSRDDLEIKVKERTGELRKMNADLQSVNKELEAFAYSVSHDLRAPVRHIAGFTELLQKHSDAVLDDKSRHHIGMILDAAKRMGSLVDDLLAFSRIGRAEPQKTTIHLEHLVKDAVREIAPDTQDRKIIWHIGNLPICYGDPAMLRLVFGNLVSNAVKFTQTCPQAEIEISSVNHTSDEVVVFVKDNGVGFDMKYKDKLFGVFQRLHSQEAFEGTGIGLATVQRIIQGHGGRVWAEASVNNGATFYVALPKAGRVNA